MSEIEELKKYFELVDEDKRKLAYDTIEEYVFFKDKLNKLKQLPMIRVSSKNRELQIATPASKLVKEYSQVVDTKRQTLLRIINSVENSAADELFEKLKAFE